MAGLAVLPLRCDVRGWPRRVGGGHELLPWQKYRALRLRVEAAESAIEDVRAEMEKVQRAAIPSAAKPALLPLEPRYDQTATYRHPKDWMAEHRVGVFNPPGQPERKAHMYLIKMEPLPRNIPDPRWAPDFPTPSRRFPGEARTPACSSALGKRNSGTSGPPGPASTAA